MLTIDKSQQLLIIVLLMIGAFYIQELPSSNVLQKILPEWPYILTLYFSVSKRYFFGVIFAFFIGITQDVFLGIPTIGLHAIIYVLSAYFMMTISLRFKHMSIFSQSLVIGLLVLFKMLVIMFYEALLYSPPVYFWVILSIPLSMLVWPLLYMLASLFN
ncbi:MAG: rod shape-determining protein MreD [Ostreibacterium sp.]